MSEWLDCSDLIDRVEEYLEEGFVSDAQELLDMYSEVYADSWEIHFLASRVHSEYDNHEESINSLLKCLEKGGENPDSLLGLMYSYVQMGLIEKGAKYLFKAFRLYPGNELVLNALIWYYIEISEYEKAISTYRHWEGLIWDNPEVRKNIGIAFERMGRYKEAEEFYRKALEENPHYDDVRDMLADCYILQGVPGKSVQLYKDYLKISPDNIESLSRLVFCLVQVKHFGEALKIAEKIARLYPNSPVGYVDAAYVYLQEKKFVRAVNSADGGLSVCPVDAEAWRVKAIAFYEMKDNEKAAKAFKEALSYDPDNPDIMRDYYRFLYETDGDKNKLLSIIQNVIDSEKPYCVEEYKFLAEYYFEKREYYKSFRYYHKALKVVPGDYELIPAMIEILLKRNHRKFVYSLLRRYVEKRGWNNVMERFYIHKMFRGKINQEGLRMLRCWYQNSSDSRRYLFSLYSKRYLNYLFYVFIYPVSALFFLIIDTEISIIAVLICGFTALTVKLFLAANRARKQLHDKIAFNRL